MLTKTPKASSLAARYGERNARIMWRRAAQRMQEVGLMHDANYDWHDRMWQVPDIAGCLGRFDDVMPDSLCRVLLRD